MRPTGLNKHNKIFEILAVAEADWSEVAKEPSSDVAGIKRSRGPLIYGMVAMAGFGNGGELLCSC